MFGDQYGAFVHVYICWLKGLSSFTQLHTHSGTHTCTHLIITLPSTTILNIKEAFSGPLLNF